MRNVTAGLGQYDLKEIGLEFRATANPAEMNYILPETLGGTKVHLLLGIKIHESNLYLSGFSCLE